METSAVIRYNCRAELANASQKDAIVPDDLRIDSIEFLNFFPQRAPHIMWLLGAGASVGAGLPSAGTLIWEFKRAIYCNSQKLSPSHFRDLYDPNFQSLVQSYLNTQSGCPQLGDDAEYSFYFNRYLPNESDRRRFLDGRLSGIKPSFGHICLAALHALDQSRIVWTTNFDPLMERAMANEAFTNHIPGGLTVASLECPSKAKDSIHDERWPLLVKLHGDFQYRKLLNTEAELQRQNEVLQQCLIDQCNRSGLAAVGYSGRDHSIMSTLSAALDGATPFPHGLFWFSRHGTPPAAPVMELLQAAKNKGIQAGYVEVGGFDELMADLFLPHHDRLPAVRDLVKQQRTRRNPVYPAYKPGNWPVIRTNALEITDFPLTCTLFQSSIGGQKEVKEVTAAFSQSVVAVRKKQGVLAFGTRNDIDEAFRKFDPKAFDRHSLIPERLRRESSPEYGLLYHAMLQGVANATGLLRSQDKKGRVLFFAANPADGTSEQSQLKTLKTSAVRLPKSSGPYLHQAVSISLDACDKRVWVLLEPTVYVTKDGKAPYLGEDRNDLVREDLVTRYNDVANNWIVFWVDFLTSRFGNPLRIVFPDKSHTEAVFKVSATTAYSKRT